MLGKLQIALAMLAKLINPTRFLLTGREKVLQTAVCYDVLTLVGLLRSDALSLVRHEARRLGLEPLHSAPDDALDPIWQTVGGNPLALRLVVGQLLNQDLPSVLDDLSSVRSQPAKTMYDYLYSYAWQRLDEPTQIVFMSLTQFGADGGDLAQFWSYCSVQKSLR